MVEGETYKVVGKAAGLTKPKLVDGTLIYHADGDWCMAAAAAIEEYVESRQPPTARKAVLSLKYIDYIDTVGAAMLLRLKSNWENLGIHVSLEDIDPRHQRLISEIERVLTPEDWQPDKVKAPSTLSKIGELMYRGWRDFLGLTSLAGACVAAFFERLFSAKSFRVAAIVSHANRSGSSAVPIIFLMSFVIGAIIAQQGAYQLEYYGAGILAVDFVGVLVSRDLGVLLTAIMVAGRSGSAYTAEIGSMKMREEIDALTVIGLDPVDILVLPRVIGLVIALPILTVIADVVALFGAMLASWAYIGLSFDVFLERLRDAVTLPYFVLGIVKAPFMALIIGLIACSEGFKVQGDTESLGYRTTTSVVKSIFMVIVIDGIFAALSASLGY